MASFSTNQPACLSATLCSESEEEQKTVLEKDTAVDEQILPDVRDCVVQFYRSAEQAKGLYGSKDKYDGSFGFDRFSSLVAPGTIRHYQKIKNLIPLKPPTHTGQIQKESKNYKAETFSEYCCPYVSIGKIQ